MSSASKLIMSATLPSPVFYNLGWFSPHMTVGGSTVKIQGRLESWRWLRVGGSLTLFLSCQIQNQRVLSFLGFQLPHRAGGTWHGYKTLALVSETGVFVLTTLLISVLQVTKPTQCLIFVSVICLKWGYTSGNISEKARCYTNFYFCCFQDY